MRDAKEGKFVEPSDKEKAEFEIYDQLMASDTDDEPAIPHISPATLEEPIIYPSPDFPTPSRHTTTSLQPIVESAPLPHILTPPGLDSNFMDAAARSIAQVDFIDPLVLWAPSTHQMRLLPEIALFATDNARQLHIDHDDNLSIRTSDLRMASWLPPLQTPHNPPTAHSKVTRIDIE